MGLDDKNAPALISILATAAFDTATLFASNLFWTPIIICKALLDLE